MTDRFWIVFSGALAAWNIHTAVTTDHVLVSWASSCLAGFAIGFFTVCTIDLVRSSD